MKLFLIILEALLLLGTTISWMVMAFYLTIKLEDRFILDNTKDTFIVVSLFVLNLLIYAGMLYCILKLSNILINKIENGKRKNNPNKA